MRMESPSAPMHDGAQGMAMSTSVSMMSVDASGSTSSHAPSHSARAASVNMALVPKQAVRIRHKQHTPLRMVMKAMHPQPLLHLV